MISIIIPTLNAQATLPACLNVFIPAVVDGLVREVIIADGGSSDLTLKIADETGAQIVSCAPGRGTQMAAGALQAKSNWLMFVHADTVLCAGWEREVEAFINRTEREHPDGVAAAFRFALDDAGLKPRLLEALVAVRSTLLRLPYGDQGLLIQKRLYKHVGGFRNIPLMEDVDLMRRLRRNQIHILRGKALTSAVRFRRDGYVKRSSRNLFCLLLYFLKVPSKVIAKFYE